MITTTNAGQASVEPPRSVTSVFNLDGQTVDVLDLKTLLITRGINVPDEIVERFGRTHRLAPVSHPFACNCLLLPGCIPAHMFHIGPAADFSLATSDAGRPCLTYRGKVVTEVDFPKATSFYEQRTSSGFPFQMMAVLQGLDVVSFPYLWPCQFRLGRIALPLLLSGQHHAGHEAGRTGLAAESFA